MSFPVNTTMFRVKLGKSSGNQSSWPAGLGWPHQHGPKTLLLHLGRMAMSLNLSFPINKKGLTQQYRPPKSVVGDQRSKVLDTSQGCIKRSKKVRSHPSKKTRVLWITASPWYTGDYSVVPKYSVHVHPGGGCSCGEAEGSHKTKSSLNWARHEK